MNLKLMLNQAAETPHNTGKMRKPLFDEMLPVQYRLRIQLWVTPDIKANPAHA